MPGLRSAVMNMVDLLVMAIQCWRRFTNNSLSLDLERLLRTHMRCGPSRFICFCKPYRPHPTLWSPHTSRWDSESLHRVGRFRDSDDSAIILDRPVPSCRVVPRSGHRRRRIRDAPFHVWRVMRVAKHQSPCCLVPTPRNHSLVRGVPETR